MFAKWLEECQRLFQKTRFISQLAAFLISIVAIFSLSSIFRAVYYNQEYLINNWDKFLISVVFHILVSLFFATRFVLLFFNSKKSFWLSQLFWLMCIIILFAYSAVTKESIYGFFYTPPKSDISFGLDYYPQIFLHASDSFAILAFLYFFVSPIRQFITLLIPLFIRK
ncbi:hypothetical protein BH18ACI1_BH18ACI1_13920 [soil metagenome]